MSLYDAWTALRHGGNLLSSAALAGLPAPGRPPRGLSYALRDRQLARAKARPGQKLGELLDAVLEQGCGLYGWDKQVKAAEAVRLLDGTQHKPRRIWRAAGHASLFVFTAEVPRLSQGRGRRALAQAAEYLRRRGEAFALVTNGAEWRLLWAAQDALAFVEWEAERWLEAELLSPEFELLRRLLSKASLQVPAGKQLSLLEAAVEDSRRGEAALTQELGERVRQAVELLLVARQGQLTAIGADPLAGERGEGEPGLSELYVAACHFVMRLVVVLFAEARGELLPTENPIYHRSYGLSGLWERLERMGAARRKEGRSAWASLLALFALLYRGSAHPALPLVAYGGALFAPGEPGGGPVSRALHALEARQGPPSDEQLYQLLGLLTRTTQLVHEGKSRRRVAARVDFSQLTSEYIGILYEGLLDYELHRAGEAPVLFLKLGDQPALPLDRLEALEDKALTALVGKLQKDKRAGDEAEAEQDSLQEQEELPEQEGLQLEEEAAPTDPHERARARARAWAERAARLGGLVSKPRSKKPAARLTYEANLSQAAEGLLGALKLPGELYLVRWGGTRKGSGTFYTRPQLTLPTVRRTLEPLVYPNIGGGGVTRNNEVVRPQSPDSKAPAGASEGPSLPTKNAIDRASPKPRAQPAAPATGLANEGPAGGIATPEAILALKLCDPAMGSGSFLVAALRVLTEALAESLYAHDRVRRDGQAVHIDCALLSEADRSLPAEGFDERLQATLRRAVVDHCLYGVDKDPLAVELARVSLWVETLDPKLPFTFLDHKLRCGDSLVGSWMDRFRDYPLCALLRESPDKKYKGVHFEANAWHKALKDKKDAAAKSQATLLSGQGAMPFTGGDDAALKAAIERVRRLYRELKRAPASQPAERARVWRERILPDPALATVREAFDLWCALWFWPLDALDDMPLPDSLLSPSEEARRLAKAVAARQRFFHWELEFPDVFTEAGAGFDAVVGNPPWDVAKPSSKEFFSSYDPVYRSYGKQEALRQQRALFDSPERGVAIEGDWLAYVGDFKARSNFVRNAAHPYGDAKGAGHGGGSISFTRGKGSDALHDSWRARRARYTGLSDPAHAFVHQGSADLNLYKMFLEQGYTLLKAGGQLGLIVPSGVYTDKGSGALRRLLLEGCRWRWLYSFENRKKIFDIDSRFKFCALIAEKGGQTEAIRVAFMRRELKDWSEAAGAMDYPVDRVHAYSPKSLSLLEIRSERDLQVLSKMYENGVLLGDDSPEGWGIKYATEFHMTNDSKLFIRREKAEAEGYKADVYGRWVNEAGDVLLPLVQGVMLHQFDFFQKSWVSGTGLKAKWDLDAWNDKQLKAQFYLEASGAKIATKPRVLQFKASVRRIARNTDERMLISAFVPGWPCGDVASALYCSDDTASVSLVGVLNSFCLDHCARGRCSGTHVDYHYMEEFPLVRPKRTVMTWFSRAVLRLSGAHECFSPVWTKLPEIVSGWCWRRMWAVSRHERLRIRAIVDAVVAAMFGMSRDDFSYILKDCDHPDTGNNFTAQLDATGFWRVDKKQPPELRHTVLSLVAFDALSAAISAAGGDRDAGIEAFCAQNEGDGWMLPETLCIAELGLHRTVDVGVYDARAKTPQPVRSALGPRFLDWQLAQTPEESWAECARHAEALKALMPAPPAAVEGGDTGGKRGRGQKKAQPQLSLLDEED